MHNRVILASVVMLASGGMWAALSAQSEQRGNVHATAARLEGGALARPPLGTRASASSPVVSDEVEVGTRPGGSESWVPSPYRPSASSAAAPPHALEGDASWAEPESVEARRHRIEAQLPPAERAVLDFYVALGTIAAESSTSCEQLGVRLSQLVDERGAAVRQLYTSPETANVAKQRLEAAAFEELEHFRAQLRDALGRCPDDADMLGALRKLSMLARG